MGRLLVSRLVSLVPTLILATFGVFLLVHLAPGDPAVALAGDGASREQVQRIREQEGLDRPLVIQYVDWVSHAARGDLGTSITTRSSISDAIRQTLPVTLQLVAGAMVVALVLGILAGVASARRANTTADAAISSAAAMGAAVPSFWLGLVLVSVFALQLGWFPATGYVGLGTDPGLAVRQLVLPSIALGIAGAAEVARQLRAVMIDQLSSDHVRTLRAKGLPARRVVWVHALKGSAVPLITVIGLQVSRFLGATVVVEAVFGISGIGSLVTIAARNRDYPMVEGVVVVLAVLVIATNVVVDVCYRLVDPRIR